MTICLISLLVFFVVYYLKQIACCPLLSFFFFFMFHAQQEGLPHTHAHLQQTTYVEGTAEENSNRKEKKKIGLCIHFTNYSRVI